MVPLSLTYSIRKVDGLPALRLLFCCCWVATWLCCCNCRLWLQQHTAVQGLQKAFKQDKADDGNAMHKSKDSAEECFPPCCWCSIMTTGTSHYWGKTRSSILKRISPVEEILSDGTEDLIEMHNCYRQTWFELFWKNPIFFCLNMLYYAGNLNTNNLCCQTILNGSSCIPAIWLCVQRPT